jgi:hypothetical protein
MVKYINVSVPSVSGAIVGSPDQFYAWQPSSWPEAPKSWIPELATAVRRIIEESILNEISNVIDDAKGNLEHRGFVVAIALMCALDAISSYGYGAQSGNQIPTFVQAHFGQEYRSHASALLQLYRHCLIHSWSLPKAAIKPGNDPIKEVHGVLSFGLLHFREALFQATEDFFKKLETNNVLQEMTLLRYRKIKKDAIE